MQQYADDTGRKREILQQLPIGKKVDEIEAEYEKINTFSKSAAYALMEKYRNIVLCKDCIYRAHEKTGYDWCRLAKGLDESLGESEGCSRGKEKE